MPQLSAWAVLRPRCTVVIVILVSVAAAEAATLTDLASIRATKRLTAIRVTEPIRVDGVLDEAAWEQAPVATDFYQQQPEEFAIARRRTEVRFLYDEDYLYVGAIMYDDQPGRLVVNDLKRDFGARESDSFGLVLDTFKDQRSSYGFLINPGGAVRETQAFDNGRRNDFNWNGVWFAKPALRPDGWSAEYAIPFRTLRFPEGAGQEWGLQLVRTARRDNEISMWAPVPRQFTHYNVSYAGTLTGITGVERGRDLKITPFATAQVTRPHESRPGWGGDADGGLDLKWGITSSLLLDGTWRTDFSQVEADEQQINLTRFSLFFPEKRQFFLESPGTFQIGLVEGEDEDPRRDLVPFFSRRIGLRGGEPIPVLGGVRLTGQAGRQSIGFLSMQTATHDGVPGDNFTAGRVTRELAQRGFVGAFYFGRESSGSGGFNRVGGVDLRFMPARNLEVEAFGMRSESRGGIGDWAGRVGFRLDSDAHRARGGVLHVGDDFQHDLGFVRRRGIETAFGTYRRIFRVRSGSSRIREHSIGASFESTTNVGFGEAFTRIGGLNYKTLFMDGGTIEARVNTSYERIDTPFTIGNLEVAAGQYHFEDVGLDYQSGRSARISAGVGVSAGEFWEGSQRAVTGSLRVRFNAHFAASTTVARNHVDLRQGSFDADLVGVRLDWSLTPRMFLNAFLQYNGETDTYLSNVRFNLIHRPLSDVYVVWNETRLAGDTRRALLLKFTQLLAF